MRPHLLLPTLLALAGPALASGEVADGSTWTNSDGSATVSVDVTQNSSANDASVTFTDGGGSTSTSVTGTLGPSSSEDHPTVTDSGQASTTEGTFRVHDGKVQEKNDQGDWVDWREKKPKKKQGADGSLYLRVGDPAPSPGWLHPPTGQSVRLVQGERAPFAGFFTGEEVTSLPE